LGAQLINKKSHSRISEPTRTTKVSRSLFFRTSMIQPILNLKNREMSILNKGPKQRHLNCFKRSVVKILKLLTWKRLKRIISQFHKKSCKMWLFKLARHLAPLKAETQVFVIKVPIRQQETLIFEDDLRSNVN
jgi:hypothetical protein